MGKFRLRKISAKLPACKSSVECKFMLLTSSTLRKYIKRYCQELGVKSML